MIPTKDKNILLLPVTDGGVTQPFNMPNIAGYNSAKPQHNGLDLGWTKTMYCNILACQDGTVVDVYNNNSSFGNGIVLQHDYADGTHRWTGYVHLKNAPTLKKGAVVKQGDVIGIRGGSPYVNGKAKYGVHLHLYTTSCNKAAYTWNTMKANVINPFPLLYKSKKVNYNVLATSASAMMNQLKYMEDVIPEVTAPVERNELVNQLTESASNLRVRLDPSLNGTIIGFLKKDAYYNWYETVKADGYTWYKIQEAPEAQWCAQTGTMTVLPKKTEVEILKEEITKLNDQISKLTGELDTVNANVTKLTNKNNLLINRITQIRNITMEE